MQQAGSANLVPLLVLPTIASLPETSGQELEEIEPDERVAACKPRPKG